MIPLKSDYWTPNLVEKQKSVGGKITEVQRRIATQNERQQLLRDSTTSSQKTMNQLLEFQRLSLQKNVRPTTEEQESMAESQRRFLANQKQYQSLNQTIVQLNEKLSQLEDTQRELKKQFEQQEAPILEQFHVLYDRHEFKVAFIKLAFLLPLLLAVVLVVSQISRRDLCSAYLRFWSRRTIEGCSGDPRPFSLPILQIHINPRGPCNRDPDSGLSTQNGCFSQNGMVVATVSRGL